MSLCTYNNNVWNPRNKETQLRVDRIEYLWDNIEYTRLDALPELEIDIPIWLIAPVNSKLDIHI